MHVIAISAILSLFSPTPARAADYDSKILNDWALKTIQDLTTHCDQITHSVWIKRYNTAAISIAEQMKSFSNEEVKKASELDPFSDLAEVILPMYLPKNYPSKGAFITCMDSFEDFKKSTPAKRAQAIKNLEECYHASYRDEQREVLQGYLKCLKEMKK